MFRSSLSRHGPGPLSAYANSCLAWVQALGISFSILAGNRYNEFASCLAFKADPARRPIAKNVAPCVDQNFVPMRAAITATGRFGKSFSELRQVVAHFFSIKKAPLSVGPVGYWPGVHKDFPRCSIASPRSAWSESQKILRWFVYFSVPRCC